MTPKAAAQLICVFVFVYAKHRFSHDAAQILFSQIFKCFFSTKGQPEKKKKTYRQTILHIFHFRTQEKTINLYCTF